MRPIALLVPTLLALALAPPASPVGGTSSGLSDLALAGWWAPTWYQDTDSSNYKADYITSFTFDGDWRGNNNWNNLPYYAVPAYVYYAVIETTTHYFLVYADFHPRDWSESCAFFNCHENDMEGVMVVVKKDGSTYGAFHAMFTVAHTNFYSYKDYQSSLSNAVTDGREAIDGDVQFQGSHHPYVYVEAKGHGVYGAKRWETNGCPGGDCVVYVYTGTAEQPSSGNDRSVGYALRSMNEIWNRRFDYTYTFASYGTFRGDDYEDNSANAPWGWDDGDDGAVYRGDLYMKPAYMVQYYHDGLGTFSQSYVYASDGAAR